MSFRRGSGWANNMDPESIVCMIVKIDELRSRLKADDFLLS